MSTPSLIKAQVHSSPYYLVNLFQFRLTVSIVSGSTMFHVRPPIGDVGPAVEPLVGAIAPAAPNLGDVNDRTHGITVTVWALVWGHIKADIAM